MITYGIVAEYNPFHKGHAYQIEETRKKTGADYIIAVISGDFVQRGAPAIINKYERAKMALDNGVDLVLELPVTAALSSAEGFARGGVGILHKLGVVDGISFGSEIHHPEELDTLKEIAGFFNHEPEGYKQFLEENLKSGMSYPAARAKAFSDYSQNGIDYESLFSAPNNILAIEYLRALSYFNSNMDVCCISRQGSDYHDTSLSKAYPSATALRETLKDDRIFCLTLDQIPDNVRATLGRFHHIGACLHEYDFSDLLFAAMIHEHFRLDQFGQMNAELAERIYNKTELFEDWSQFVTLLKTKNQTYTGISRSLCQLMLGLTKEDFQIAKQTDYSPYAHILGFRKSAAPLLKEISEKATLPVITKVAADTKSLSPDADYLFGLDWQAASTYNRIAFSKSGEKVLDDTRHPLIYL